MLQIDSKYAGVVDGWESAPTGGHTFTLTDICLHQADKAGTWEQAATIINLKSTDFGEQRQPATQEDVWVLLLDPGATRGGGRVSDEDAQGACANFFPSMGAEELANSCVPRRLAPPTH